ncbi:MAG: DDE-type integrase/transposase/recombinase [Polyangiales bacterium]
MGWMSDVQQKKRAIDLVHAGVPVTEVALCFGKSRQCLHKWLRRYEAEGEAGLEERSRAPHEPAHAVSEQMRRRIVQRGRRHNKDGARVVQDWLLGLELSERVPAASTVHRILDEAGLVQRRRRTRAPVLQPRPSKWPEPSAPNEVWAVDFKGEFTVGGRWCHPLTLTDSYSRYVLRIDAQQGQDTHTTQRHLWRAFRTYGLPKAIRCDNGDPFVHAAAPRGLSHLSSVWIRLGIDIQRIDSGKPAQNGRHERFHRELKRHTARPAAENFAAQQKRFARFKHRFNHERPHRALQMSRPAAHYRPSERACPDAIPAVTHPTAETVLRVAHDGTIRFKSRRHYLTASLGAQTIGVTEVDDALFSLSYGSMELGVITYRTKEPQICLVP